MTTTKTEIATTQRNEGFETMSRNSPNVSHASITHSQNTLYNTTSGLHYPTCGLGGGSVSSGVSGFTGQDAWMYLANESD